MADNETSADGANKSQQLGVFINNVAGPVGRLLPYIFFDRKDTKGRYAKNAFKGSFAFPKNDEKGEVNKLTTFTKARLAAIEGAQAASPADWPVDLDKQLVTKPWRDGDKKAEKDGYAGNWVIQSSAFKSCDKLRLIDRKKKDIDASAFYAGCYVMPIFTVMPYGPKTETIKIRDSETGEVTEEETRTWGVTFKLAGVMFVRDGEPIASSGGGSGVDINAIPDLPDESGDDESPL